MDDLLAQPTRREIYATISKHPGISARDVQRMARLGWGETAYHLDQLTKAGVLRRERGGRRDYYFAAKTTWEDRRLFKALRSPTQRRLLLALSARPGLTLAELTERVGLSLSTTSFHVRQLLADSLVTGSREANTRRYSAVRPEHVAELARTYRESFEDRLVDQFVETWSGLFQA